ncbi:NTF2-related export protein-like [Phymastichus coffea]|uniref:NTF2-related export protein-like n=1 Tax=Phymastichus coffea TaxID=108790 RepID=UPI00273C374D|nr:NTF2-related export protein-like [Phymastichus coffea]
MDENLKNKIDLACRTAEEFTKLYYDSLDKQKYLMSKLYMDNAILIWNGNGIEGKDQIQNFWTDLPPSVHTINSLDALPITVPAVANQHTFLIKVSGQVKYQNKKIGKSFNQNFTITALDNKWKIVSDCFRTQESLDS